jgi:hypothetical protein
MRLLMRSLLLAVTMLCAAGLATACGSSVGSSVSSAISSLTASSSPGESTTSPPATVSSSAEVTTTSPPTTSVPSVTSSAPATSAAPAPVAQPSATATPSGSGSPPIWIWIVIGLAVLLGATALIVRSVRRRGATAASWRTKVIDVYAEGSALLDAMKIAATHGLAGDRAADAQWYDIQRRSDDLARTLYALREEAPDDDARARVADVLGALQTVRSAMESERASGGAVGGPGEEMVRSRLAAFEVSLRDLRLAHYPQN